MFTDMHNIRAGIIESAISLVYFMRGSVQYTDILALSCYERQAMSNFIDKRLESEKNKMNPVY